MKFLIVDDDPSLRDVLRRSLKILGHDDIIEASDGEMAWVENFGHPRAPVIEFVISDIQMPYMTGLELTRALRARGETVPILLVTGNEDLANEAISAGADDYLLKPYGGDDLEAKIEKIIASHES